MRAYGGIAADTRIADRRRRLLDATYDLLAADGAAAVTVTGVCKRAGLTQRYFYEHFENREALLTALLDEEAAAVMAGILAATSAPGDHRDRAVAGITALLDALDADPRRAELGRRAAADDLLLLTRAKVAQRMTEAFAENAALVLPGAQAQPERARLAAPVIIGGVLQLAAAYLDGRTPREEIIDLCVRYTLATGEALLARTS